MDYFLIKQSGTVSIPKEIKPEASNSGTSNPGTSNTKTIPDLEPSVRIMADVSPLDKFDYIASEHLLSDQLKQVIEQYLPEQLWRPCVFVDPKKKEQKTFWFLPPLPYIPKQVITASNGIPCSVCVDEQDFAKKAPGILRIRNPKGTVFLIVHLSIAESILRRGICGLELVRLTGQ